MPALPPVPNVLRADFQWSLPGVALITTKQYFRYSGGAPTATDAAALAADCYSAMAATSTLWSDDVSLVNVKVTDLSSSNGGQGEHAQSTSGSRGTLDMPASNCLLVNYVINRRYRGGKPRSYWPWLSTNDYSTPTQWAPASLTEVDSKLATFYAAVIGASSGSTTITDHVNVSYYQGFKVETSPSSGRARNASTPRANPVVDVITTYAAAGRIASQRRRLGR